MNALDIVLLALIVGVAALAIAKLARDRKRGKGTCGCGCANCAMQCDRRKPVSDGEAKPPRQ